MQKTSRGSAFVSASSRLFRWELPRLSTGGQVRSVLGATRTAPTPAPTWLVPPTSRDERVGLVRELSFHDPEAMSWRCLKGTLRTASQKRRTRRRCDRVPFCRLEEPRASARAPRIHAVRSPIQRLELRLQQLWSARPTRALGDRGCRGPRVSRSSSAWSWHSRSYLPVSVRGRRHSSPVHGRFRTVA